MQMVCEQVLIKMVVIVLAWVLSLPSESWHFCIHPNKLQRVFYPLPHPRRAAHKLSDPLPDVGQLFSEAFMYMPPLPSQSPLMAAYTRLATTCYGVFHRIWW